MSFLNKVALVTGSSSGIGAAIAVLFAREGAHVVIVDKNEEKLKNVSETCEKFGKKPLVIKADVTIDDEAKDIIKKTIDTYGKLDILVNSAGILRFGCITEGNILKAYDETLSTNLRAIIHITTLAAPYLIESKGNIVNISSITSLRISNDKHMLPYCVSKAAVDHFTRGAALELAASNVRVNSINPGPVKTNILDAAKVPGSDVLWDNMKNDTALGKIAEPEEIADLVLYLASDKARSITGSNFVCDNGYLLKN